MTGGHVFDALAMDYDADFTDSIIGGMLRDDVHGLLEGVWWEGDTVLEIGCGTGADALWLTERGVKVCATDVSEGMRTVTRAKLGAGCDVRHLDLNDLPTVWEGGGYDGVLSNFGAMNCAEDLGAVSDWLAMRTRPDGQLVLVIMARYCLWEALWYGLRGDWETARRRWSGVWHFKGANDMTGIVVRYPTVGTVRGAFGRHFDVERVMPLGFGLPPTAIYGVIEKRPRWLRLLRGVEKWAQKRAWLANVSDHYVIVLKKRGR